MTAFSQTPWIACAKANPHAKLRLFCFPYAGGSSLVFRNWQSALPGTIQVCPIELPGRGYRLMEPLFQDITSLIKTMVIDIQALCDLPFAFFGHSLGALISFELACCLRREYGQVPVQLFVSGRQAPKIPDFSPINNLSEPDLINEICRLGGTPKTVLENPEMIKLLLPMIRADLKIDETYKYQYSEPFDCPITVFGGWEDPETKIEDLQAWQEYTTAKFVLKMFSGNHFFINTAQDLLLESIKVMLFEIAQGNNNLI
ncbi:MAG: thioesterase [Nodularia sp. (in: Bacteria)]|nr:MAG: thioesterase [Nodularia sp. (in: cyanobacteria)]